MPSPACPSPTCSTHYLLIFKYICFKGRFRVKNVVLNQLGSTGENLELTVNARDASPPVDPTLSSDALTTCNCIFIEPPI